MTDEEDDQRPRDVLEIGGSVRSTGRSEERTSRETRVNFSRRPTGPQVPREPSRARLLLDRVEHNRRLLFTGVATAAVLALVVALGLVFNQPAPASADLTTAAGLSPDQAACAAYGAIEGELSQSMIERYNVGLSPSRELFRKEIRRLDTLGHAFPSADYRLVIAFEAVADHSSALLHGMPLAQHRGTPPRYETLAAARRVCLDVAGYDTASASVVGTGHPPPSAAAQARVDAKSD